MHNFAVGQVWSYKSRPQDLNSLLTIVHIDHEEQVSIVHIAIQGLKMKNSSAPEGYSSTVGHLPVSIDSLRESVCNLEQSVDVLPNYKEGYDQWRAAFDEGGAGFFTIPVCDIVDYLEQTLG